MQLAEALVLVGQLSRTINYPRDPDEIASMARALMHAADSTQVDASQVVEECARLSNYCPTDHDLLSVAGVIRDRRVTARDLADSRADWDRNPKCPACNRTGWVIRHWLHTFQANRVEKEEITKAEADALWPKIRSQQPGATRQMIYTTAQKCRECGAANARGAA